MAEARLPLWACNKSNTYCSATVAATARPPVSWLRVDMRHAYYLLLTTDYLLLTAYHLPLTTHYLLLTTYYLLPARRYEARRLSCLGGRQRFLCLLPGNCCWWCASQIGSERYGD